MLAFHPIGHCTIKQFIELWPVIVMNEMAQLMDHNILYALFWGLDQVHIKRKLPFAG